MKAVVAAFNQEKALVGAFSVITNLRMELFGALLSTLYCALCRLLRVLRRHVPQREPRGVSPHRDAELHLPGLSSTSSPVHSTLCYMPLNTFWLSGVRQVRHRSQAGLSAGSKVSKHTGDS